MNFTDMHTIEQAQELAPPPRLITEEERRRHRAQQRRLLIAEEDEHHRLLWAERFPEDVLIEQAFYIDPRRRRRTGGRATAIGGSTRSPAAPSSSRRWKTPPFPRMTRARMTSPRRRRCHPRQRTLTTTTGRIRLVGAVAGVAVLVVLSIYYFVLVSYFIFCLIFSSAYGSENCVCADEHVL
jgi:hypothetical protein